MTSFEIIQAILGFFQVLTGLLIAWFVHKLSKNQVSIEAVQHVTEQWQDLNMAVACDKDLQKALVKMGYENDPVEELQTKYIVYYILNILSEAYSAYVKGLITEDFYHKMMRDQSALLCRNYQQLEKIISGSRGYPNAFIDSLREQIRHQRVVEANVGNVESKSIGT